MARQDAAHGLMEVGSILLNPLEYFEGDRHETLFSIWNYYDIAGDGDSGISFFHLSCIWKNYPFSNRNYRLILHFQDNERFIPQGTKSFISLVPCDGDVFFPSKRNQDWILLWACSFLGTFFACADGGSSWKAMTHEPSSRWFPMSDINQDTGISNCQRLYTWTNK